MGSCRDNAKQDELNSNSPTGASSGIPEASGGNRGENMNFIDKYRIKRMLQKVADYDSNDLLGMVGLEKRSVAGDILADVGFFGIGCLCGAVAGLIFAPRPAA